MVLSLRLSYLLESKLHKQMMTYQSMKRGCMDTFQPKYLLFACLVCHLI